MPKIPSYIIDYVNLPENEQRISDWLTGFLTKEEQLYSKINLFHSLFLTTSDNRIRNQLALLLTYVAHPESLKVLFDAIRNNIQTDDVGTLVYATSFFDSGDYLPILIDVLIEKDNSVVFDVFRSLKAIKSLSLPSKEDALARLEETLHQTDPEREKYDELLVILEHIRGIPVSNV
jgi:hypothetical protein